MATKQEILKEMARRELNRREQSNTPNPISQQGLVERLFGNEASEQVQTLGREFGGPVQRGINTGLFGLPATGKDPLDRQLDKELRPETTAGKATEIIFQGAGLLGGGSARLAGKAARTGATLTAKAVRGGASFGATQIFDPQDSVGKQFIRQSVQAAEGAVGGLAVGALATPLLKFGRQISTAMKLSKTEGIGFGKALGAARNTDKLAEATLKANKFAPITRQMADSVDDISNRVLNENTKLRKIVGADKLSVEEAQAFRKILKQVPGSIRNSLKKQDAELVTKLLKKPVEGKILGPKGETLSVFDKSKPPLEINISDAMRIRTSIGDALFKNQNVIKRGQEIMRKWEESKSIANNAASRSLVKKGLYKSEHAAKLALQQADDVMTSFYKTRKPVIDILYKNGNTRNPLTPDSVRTALNSENGREAMNNFYSKFGQTSSQYVNQAQKILKRQKFNKALKTGVGHGLRFLLIEEAVRRGVRLGGGE